MATWNYEQYQAWIDGGCPKNNSITALSLHNNQLTSIPPDIGQLRNLTVLSLHNNQLTSIQLNINYSTQNTWDYPDPNNNNAPIINPGYFFQYSIAPSSVSFYYLLF
jgi:Leucine-rich repeat (LRR) protein